jgi:hypothetical protein
MRAAPEMTWLRTPACCLYHSGTAELRTTRLRRKSLALRRRDRRLLPAQRRFHFRHVLADGVFHLALEGAGGFFGLLAQVFQLVQFHLARDFGFDVVQVTLGAAVQRPGHARHLGQLFRTDDDQGHDPDDGNFGKTEVDHR